MSLPYGDPKWATGNPAIVAPVELPRFSCPIPGVNAAYILKQKWRVSLNAFALTAISTPHPDYASFYLVEEGERQSVGLGQVEWERTYAAIPATHWEPENFTYAYPGSADAILNQSPNARPRIVESRVKHEYFLCAAGQTYTDPTAIPIIEKTRFCMVGVVGGSNVGAPWVETQYISDGVTIAGNVFQLTTPSFTDYQAMMHDASTNGWSATASTQTIAYDSTNHLNYIPLTGTGAAVYGGLIVAETSRKSRWMGNMFVRQTRYVLAS